jgi:hypothetical protein
MEQIYSINTFSTKSSVIDKLSKQKFDLVRIPVIIPRTFITIDNEPTIVTIHDIILRTGTGVIVETLGKRNYHILGYIMSKLDDDFVIDLVSSFGFNNLDDTSDVFYNLLWHLSIHHHPFASNLSPEEIQYISGLTCDQLIELLPSSYLDTIGNNTQRSKDKASLLYAIVSGKSLPHREVNFSKRYQEVERYPPSIVWKIADIRWNITRTKDTKFIYYTPYELVAGRSNTIDNIEKIFLMANHENIHDLIEEYGIIFPPKLKINAESILESFLKQISEYNDVFNRPDDIILFPTILSQGKTEDTKRRLRQYTTKELINTYEPTSDWITRENLIDIIIRDGLSPARWSWRHLHCQNDDTMNIHEFKQHGDINKDDPNDPTLSYGIQANYRCYQISELITMFSEYPEEFRDPDYHRDNLGIDPTTGLEYSRSFSVESIKRLRELLRQSPKEYNVKNLVDVIDRKLTTLDENMLKIKRMKEEYDQFDVNQQYLANLFIVWVFLYGMWMRFWKGPGYPWVYSPSDIDMCIPSDRDEHIFIQNVIVMAIKNNYDQDSSLKLWIERLPLIYYNFKSDESILGNITVMQHLKSFLVGKHCMGFGADDFLGTGYFLITRLLGFKQGDPFDKFVANMIPPLLDMERQVIDNQLMEDSELNKSINEIYSKGLNIPDEIIEKMSVLSERNDELLKPLKQQDTFEPSKVKLNAHIITH